LRLNNLSDSGIGGTKDFHAAFDFRSLLNGADPEGNFHSEPLTDFEAENLGCRAEASRFGFEFIFAWEESGSLKKSVLVGGHGAQFAGGQGPERNAGRRDWEVLRVSHSTGDNGIVALPESRGSQQQAQQN